MQDMLRNIAALIDEKDGFTVITHVSPDGDALGSSFALYGALLQLGKRAQVVCEDEVPRAYRFLPWAEAVLTPENALQTEYVISVDCADRQRLGSAVRLFDGAQDTVNIDHHGTNIGFAAHNAVAPKAAAAGEMIAALLAMLPVRVDESIATCLYTAIMTDTGNFAYNNTKPETLRCAAALLAAGADNTDIYRRIYAAVPYRKQKLMGCALSNMTLFAEGKIALTYLHLADYERYGAESADSDGVVERLRDIEGVEIAVFIREQAENVYKVSMRSKIAADVSRVAAELGGGGHKHAAGGTVHGTATETQAKTVALCESALKEVWKEL
ncbi:MAG: bifunctional oligoribonuclease/PAP phosphatase NrnA [Clostridiales bacterium]|nr:bifunctional oligoribonuclease/PAP phosphatase NrnA [Clostridiales bacterium]